MIATTIQLEKDFEAIPGVLLIARDRPRVNAALQDLSIITDKTWAAINETNHPPDLFQYNGRVVRVVEENGLAAISDLSRAETNYELAARVEFYRIVRGEEVPARPPTDLATNLLATPNPPLPRLKSLSLVPVFAPDGGLQCRPGYYKKTGTLYLPAKGTKIPMVADEPDDEDLDEARRLIYEEVLVDFPFVTDSDLAHAVATTPSAVCEGHGCGAHAAARLHQADAGDWRYQARAATRIYSHG